MPDVAWTFERKIAAFRGKRQSEILTGVRSMHAYPAVLDSIAQSGVDFIYLDQQHGTVSLSDIQIAVAILAQYQCVVLVRTADQKSDSIGAALDAGAHGVIVPEIETEQQAKDMVSASLHPPQGKRSWGSFALGKSGYNSPQDLTAPLCIPLVETRRGIANIESIVGVAGVDAIYVGRFDLAFDMQVPLIEIGRNEIHNEAISRVKKACDSRQIPMGTSGNFTQLAAQGFRILTVSSEIELVKKGLTAYLEGK